MKLLSVLKANYEYRRRQHKCYIDWTGSHCSSNVFCRLSSVRFCGRLLQLTCWQPKTSAMLLAVATPFACWEYNITLMIQTLCCIGSGCLKTSCTPCVKCCGLTMSHSVKLAYFCFVSLLVVVSLILKSSIENPSAYVLQKTGCEDSLQQYSLLNIQEQLRLQPNRRQNVLLPVHPLPRVRTRYVASK